MSFQPTVALPRATCTTDAPRPTCSGNSSDSSCSGRPVSAQFCANAAASPSTAGPTTRTCVSRHSRSSRASPHHSSAMPTPPVKPVRSSTMSTLRWVRWFCLNGEIAYGLRNHSTWTPHDCMWAMCADSMSRPPTASRSTRTRTP